LWITVLERLSQHRILKYVSALKAIALAIQLVFDKIEKNHSISLTGH
jgi:hypothetical protein